MTITRYFLKLIGKDIFIIMINISQSSCMVGYSCCAIRYLIANICWVCNTACTSSLLDMNSFHHHHVSILFFLSNLTELSPSFSTGSSPVGFLHNSQLCHVFLITPTFRVKYIHTTSQRISLVPEDRDYKTTYNTCGVIRLHNQGKFWVLQKRWYLYLHCTYGCHRLKGNIRVPTQVALATVKRDR